MDKRIHTISSHFLTPFSHKLKQANSAFETLLPCTVDSAYNIHGYTGQPVVMAT